MKSLKTWNQDLQIQLVYPYHKHQQAMQNNINRGKHLNVTRSESWPGILLHKLPPRISHAEQYHDQVIHHTITMVMELMVTQHQGLRRKDFQGDHHWTPQLMAGNVFPHLVQMQGTMYEISTALKEKETRYSRVIDNVEKIFLEREIPAAWKTSYASQQLALKHADQFPKFDHDKTRYGRNFWLQYWERADTFMTRIATETGTSALLLWKQGTPTTRLGDAFQNISMGEEEEGYTLLEQVCLDGIKDIPRKHVAPDLDVQLEKQRLTYNIATRYFE